MDCGVGGVVTRVRVFKRRAAYSKMADEISLLLLEETKAQALDVSAEMKMFDIVLDAPMPEDVRMCRLQGAVAAFAKLVSEEILV